MLRRIDPLLAAGGDVLLFRRPELYHMTALENRHTNAPVPFVAGRDSEDRRLEAPRVSSLRMLRLVDLAPPADARLLFEKPNSRTVLKSMKGELFAFAGIWDGWKNPGNWIKTCSILTTTPNAVTSAVPRPYAIILDPNTYHLWLDRGMTNIKTVSDMLKPYDARLMRCYPVSTRINHAGNDDPECAAPVELVKVQTGLSRDGSI